MEKPLESEDRAATGRVLSESQAAAIRHVLQSCKEKLSDWKDMEPTSRSRAVVESVCLCKVISCSPSWFGLKSITNEHKKMAQSSGMLLRRVIDEGFCATEEDATTFWAETMPFVLDRATQCAEDMDAIMTDRLPKIDGGGAKVVTKSRLQCAEIVAGGFFCVFPENKSRGSTSFDFLEVHAKHPTACSFFLCYFSQVSKEPLQDLKSEAVTFTRKAVGAEAIKDLASDDTQLCDVEHDATGSIEEHPCLQADFANMYIGGGVLVGGNVQEEIRFLICPELCVSMPLSDVMLPHEAIEIVGALQYSKYAGYGGSLKCAGPTDLAEEKAKAPLDALKRHKIRIVAFDALPMPDRAVQYGAEGVMRELKKAVVAFSPNSADQLPDGGHVQEGRLGVATGNWGCGMFGGDPQLKFLLQWMAVSVSGRPRMVYCSFNDQRVDDLPGLVAALRARKATVRDLHAVLCAAEFQAAKPWRSGVFAYVEGATYKGA